MNADFIDSNVFIYLFDETDPAKRARAKTLIKEALETGAACVSFQVVQEVLNIFVKKLPITPEETRRFMGYTLVPLWRIMPSPHLYERALDLQTRYKFSFYDSLIVAAALQGGCTRLYSEDLQHDQRVEGLIITNPFLEG